ncbi:homogentisate phytyltransferase [Kovacikia minuta CCNUW1]|uniref:homogentisate phytyltransferase n=1 Tax=Kovacikia minuta TaxID=2931930 RepID=UPI001CCCEC7E|nr:homogentisate phytyltransferase [Kovacikia minuta]UBF24770.1 homogentisate phytyltransferase [Kovacikia minuta CCNUW1]
MSRTLAKPADPSNPPVKPKGIRLLASSLYAFWKFSRPHTVIGTSLSVLGLYFIALAEGRVEGGISLPFSLIPHPSSLILPLLACLCGNVYIVGLNQLEDVEIDRINKPHLPLASREFSRKQAITIIVVTGILAISLAIAGSPFLLATVGISLIIGTAYSLPPIRLKRFPFPASLCILTVRGVIVNLGLFLHFSSQREWGAGFLSSLFPPPSLPPSVLILTLFILIFTFAIAIFKDIPDMEGDRQYNIRTLTLRVGKNNVFKLALGVLIACYLGMITVGVLGLPGVNPAFLVTTHLLALGSMWLRSRSVNLQNKRSISHFYQFIWKLFFLEYLIFPIACLLG